VCVSQTGVFPLIPHIIPVRAGNNITHVATVSGCGLQQLQVPRSRCNYHNGRQLRGYSGVLRRGPTFGCRNTQIHPRRARSGHSIVSRCPVLDPPPSRSVGSPVSHVLRVGARARACVREISPSCPSVNNTCIHIYIHIYIHSTPETLGLHLSVDGNVIEVDDTDGKLSKLAHVTVC
jgi:hypothetical protein